MYGAPVQGPASENFIHTIPILTHKNWHILDLLQVSKVFFLKPLRSWNFQYKFLNETKIFESRANMEFQGVLEFGDFNHFRAFKGKYLQCCKQIMIDWTCRKILAYTYIPV